LDPSNFVNENEPLKVTTFVSPAPKSGHIWKMLRPFCVCMVVHWWRETNFHCHMSTGSFKAITTLTAYIWK